MKRYTLTLISIILAVTAAQAQLLWKIQVPGNTKPSYLFGTYHFAGSDFLNSVADFSQAIDDCDAVWGEVQRDSLNSPDAVAKMAAASKAPTDSTLSELLSKDAYKIVASVFNGYFSEFSVTLDQMNSFKPIAISAQIEALQALKYFPSQDPSAMLDMAIQTLATQKGKATHGLESIDDQIEVLFNRNLVKQAQDLLEQCKNDDKYQQLNAKLLEAYRKGNLEQIDSIMFDPTMGGDDEQYRADLIDKRNAKWAAKLMTIMPEQSVLVCVGAGHLPGAKGLISLLRKAGCTLTPVSGKEQ
jgi:uncharacterized protein YbaP (TraB family)